MLSRLMQLAVVGCLAMCAGCGRNTIRATGTVPGQVAGEIAFYTSEGPDELVGFRELIATFEAAHAGTRINLVNIADRSEFDKKLAALFAARTPPDVFLINYRRFGQFAIKGVLQPVDDYLAGSAVVKAADYYPVALEAFRFKGRQVCLPQNLSSLEVYYNRTLFQAAGLPLPRAGWTWAEFLQAAQALTRDTDGDGATDQFGLGVAPSTLRLAAFIWANGGELVDDLEAPTRLTLDSGPALEAFQWFADLQALHHVAPSRADEATESDLARFQHGAMGMYLNSRAETPELRETILGQFVWDVAPMPVGKVSATVLHSDGYCMSTASTNKELAWAFSEFALGPAGQTQLAKTGRTVPSLMAVAESPAFLSSLAPPASSQVYLDMAPFIRRLPIATTWLEVEETLDKEIERAFYGEATVEEAARAAVEATGEYFAQNLRDLAAP